VQSTLFKLNQLKNTQHSCTKGNYGFLYCAVIIIELSANTASTSASTTKHDATDYYCITAPTPCTSV